MSVLGESLVQFGPGLGHGGTSAVIAWKSAHQLSRTTINTSTDHPCDWKIFMVWVWDLITRHLFCPSLSCLFAWMIFSTGCNKVNNLTTMLGPGRQKLDRSLSCPACIFCMYTFTFAVKSLLDFGSSMTLQSLLSSYDCCWMDFSKLSLP